MNIIRAPRTHYKILLNGSPSDVKTSVMLNSQVDMFAINDVCTVLDEIGCKYDVYEVDPESRLKRQVEVER